MVLKKVELLSVFHISFAQGNYNRRGTVEANLMYCLRFITVKKSKSPTVLRFSYKKLEKITVIYCRKQKTGQKLHNKNTQKCLGFV